MALDLAGGNQSFAGAEGTEPAHCRLESRSIPLWTGKNSRGTTKKASGKISGNQRWPVGRGGRPVKTAGTVAGGMPAPGKVRGKPCPAALEVWSFVRGNFENIILTSVMVTVTAFFR
jgi:hypothetical protein